MPCVSRLYTLKRQSRHFQFIRYHSILLSCVFLQLLLVMSLHKAFFLPPWKPSLQPLPGIPEPTLTIENVKNEDKSEEGETSVVTGRVLSHGADIAQSLRETAEQNGWDCSKLIIETMCCNNPQFILFQIEACQLIIRSTFIIYMFSLSKIDS